MQNNEYITLIAEIRSCNPARDENRIRHRFRMNSTQTEAYLNILKQRQLLAQKNDKYHTTERGKNFLPHVTSSTAENTSVSQNFSNSTKFYPTTPLRSHLQKNSDC